ncbi:MAG: FMN-binding protein [Rhodococcus sp. (in: high G+C Gram-positive bacteria)]
MRRITWWLASTVTAVVLVFSYHTSTGVTPMTEVVATAPATTEASPTTAAAPTTDSAAAQTITGQSVSTRWGPVQVQITVAGGTITDATAVVYPNGNGKDQQINARAVPILESETVSAQSAGIDMVSGATVTSEGYIQSLQSAIDQANL